VPLGGRKVEDSRFLCDRWAENHNNHVHTLNNCVLGRANGFTYLDSEGPGMGEFNERIGRRVRALRGGCSWTLEELGHRAGLKPEAVSRVERGVHEPTLTTLAKLAAALGTSVAALISDESQPLPPGVISAEVLAVAMTLAVMPAERFDRARRIIGILAEREG